MIVMFESERKEEVGWRDGIDRVGDQGGESIKIGWLGAVALLEFVTPERTRTECGEGPSVFPTSNFHDVLAGAESAVDVPLGHRRAGWCVTREDRQHMDGARKFQERLA